MTKLHIHYDEAGDFLEINFGEARANYGAYIGDDTFEIRDEATDDIIGYAFHNVSKNVTNIEVDLPKATS